MRFFTSLLTLLMVGFCAYAVWDLKLDNSIAPPVPRDELAKPNPEISAIMARHNKALESQMSSAVLPQIDQSIGVIGAEYGPQSPEMIQALSDTAIMLSNQGRSDLAVTYMEKAASAARATYGTRHRETTLILHDLANLKDQAPSADEEEVTALLEEVVSIRSRLLGRDHMETRGARLSLADALFTGWLSSEEKDPESEDLIRAEKLIEEPFATAEGANDVEIMQARAARLLYGRIAFARQNYEAALAAFDETLTRPEETTDASVYLVLGRAYNDQIRALRALGRDAEADALRDAINAQLKAASQPVPAAAEEEAGENAAE